MSGRGGRMDKRITHAVVFKIQWRKSSIPESMHTKEFTLAESLNQAKQMGMSSLLLLLMRSCWRWRQLCYRCWLSPLLFLSPSLFLSSPFQLIVVFPPTAIAVTTIVFIALPLPLLSPSPILCLFAFAVTVAAVIIAAINTTAIVAIVAVFAHNCCHSCRRHCRCRHVTAMVVALATTLATALATAFNTVTALATAHVGDGERDKRGRLQGGSRVYKSCW